MPATAATNTDPGAAGRPDHPPPAETAFGPDRRDFGRYPPQPRRPLQHPAVEHHGSQGPGHRAANAVARRHRASGGRGPPRHGGGPQGRRHRDDAAPADGTHAGHLRTVGPGIFPFLRPRPRKTRLRQARCPDHAPRPDEPGRRDRHRGGRRHPPTSSAGNAAERRFLGGTAVSPSTGHRGKTSPLSRGNFLPSHFAP